MFRSVQMPVVPGDLDTNYAMIAREVARAKNEGIDLVAFPEMALPGYMLGDDWESDSFLRECDGANDDIRSLSKNGPAIVWGSVKPDWKAVGEDGRTRKYNAAFIAANGLGVSNGVFE